MTEPGNQQVRMRIYMGEKDHAGQKPLYEAVLEELVRQNAAGATVIRGIAGFGPKKRLHSAHLLTLSQDLPLIVECVDSRENVDRMIPVLRRLVGKDTLITLEPVDAVRVSTAK